MMTSRHHTIPLVAAITILSLILSSHNTIGIYAFSPTSISSSSSSRTTISIHQNLQPINQGRSIRTIQSSSNNNRRRYQTSIQALPNPLHIFQQATTRSSSATAAATTLAFAPPIANIALQSLSTISALTATITGGIFAGSLHAIAGPDHLAALIPRCCGLPWYRAVRVGAVWGLGHGVSATILGICGYLFKKGIRFSGVMGGPNGNSFDLLHHAGSFMELAIGISLIVIGLLGIKEAREWESPDDVPISCDILEESDDGKSMVKSATTTTTTPQSLSAAATPPYSSAAMAVNPNPAKRAVLFNGILHGFSWDGAPSLAPAVAISTLRGSLTFLLSYALGTMAAMALATTIIGEGTRRAAGKLDRPDLPRDLSLGSSFLALIVGVVWCALAL